MAASVTRALCLLFVALVALFAASAQATATCDMANCVTCIAGQCITCSSGYYVSQNTCVSCETDHCAECNYVRSCLRCESGYKLDYVEVSNTSITVSRRGVCTQNGAASLAGTSLTVAFAFISALAFAVMA